MIPFTALIGFGLWNHWRIDQASAIERALNEARLLAAQVDDHIGNLDNLMMGLSRAVSANPADVLTNDALLRKVKAELPGFVSNVLVFLLDGTNIGTSADPSHGRPYAAPRTISSKSWPASVSASAMSFAPVSTTNGSSPSHARSRMQSGRLLAVLAVGTRARAFPGGVARARAAGRQCRPHCQ